MRFCTRVDASLSSDAGLYPNLSLIVYFIKSLQQSIDQLRLTANQRNADFIDIDAIRGHSRQIGNVRKAVIRSP